MQKKLYVLIFLTVLVFFFAIQQASAQGWGPATNLGSNINTSNLEDGHSLSSDSSRLYLSTDRPGSQSADIWVSEYIGGWQVPTNLGSNVNSIDDEYEPSISNNGTKLYFSSDRAGGHGSVDIYMSEYIGGAWQPAVNLESNINTFNIDCCPSISSDDLKLYFISTRPGGYGEYDIWCSEYSGGSWQPPVNLGNSVNTSGFEYTAYISNDGLKLYFGSDRPGGYGGIDIWQSDNIGGVWQSPINLGPNINTSNDEVAPVVSSNGGKLYFAAFEWPGGYGDCDIWVSEYQPGVEEQTTNTLSQCHKGATIISGPLPLPTDKKCKVFDITGRIVTADKLKPGIYFIEIDGQITKKVIKVR